MLHVKVDMYDAFTATENMVKMMIHVLDVY